jgi:serine/threonine protein kinase/tetratricopeptide (TPR) repeat protein
MLDVSVGRVREIFVGCLRCDTRQEIEQLIQRECAGDIAIESAVNELLRAHDANGRFLESPLDSLLDVREPHALAGTQALLPTDLPSSLEAELTTIGPYTLMEKIGEGGMGVVYVAKQQQPIRRTVALKLIKPGMDSKQVVARFEAERQALAMMSHPNIARVLDAGASETGLPYFVMELVKGLPITEYCDSRKLDLRQRLELFVQVCDAVQHAHQKGIIHRDLKPSNILVELEDVRSIPKVIDFGVAKATQQPLTENTVYTGLSQMIGTPLYMSPEQADFSSLDVDTRSDVYSLGVVLYELLTGSTPFDRDSLKKAGFDEMRRIIREDEPVRPSSRISTLENHLASTVSNRRRIDLRELHQSLHRELDWIVMRALEKDRSRRYDSTSALAADIQRYLRGESVQACPPSSWYRLSKLVQHHRVALTTFSFVALALLVGLSASIWQAIRATTAERRSEERNQLARRAVDDMYSQVADVWLADQGMLTDLQQEFLQKALMYYSETTHEKETEPQAILESLRAQQRVAALQSKLGQHLKAEASYRKTIAKCEELLSPSPENHQARLLLVAAKAGLANMLRPLGRETESTEIALGAYADIGDFEVTRLEKLDEQKLLASSLLDLGRELIESGNVPVADDAADRCLTAWELLLDTKPESWDFRVGVARSHELLGNNRFRLRGRFAEAGKAYQEAEKRFLTLLIERPNDRQCRQSLVGVLGNHGIVCHHQARFAERVEYQRRGVAIAETLSREFPQDRKMFESYLLAVSNLAGALRGQGLEERLQEVLELRQQALTLAISLVELQPDIEQYWYRYLQMVSDSVKSHLLHGNSATADQVLEDALVRIQKRTISVAATAKNSEISRLGTIASNDAAWLLTLRASRLLDSGDHREIEKALNAITPNMRSFDSDWVMQEKVRNETNAGKDVANRLAVQDCALQHTHLTKLAELFTECVRLADWESSLPAEQPDEQLENYRSMEERCRTESAKALSAWAENAMAVVRQSRTPIIDTLSTCEAKCKEADQDWTVYSRFFHRLNRQCELERVRRLIQMAIDEFPHDGKLILLVGYLVAGPEELRNTELALKTAQEAFERSNDEQTRQYLGWAMFRAQRWEECLDVLSATIDQKEKGKIDIEHVAVIAMAHWKLDRKEKALSLLNPDYERRLAAYIERCHDRATNKREITYPTPAMLLMLDREAKRLVMAGQLPD